MECHPDEASQWHGSRHQQSFTNHLFQDDYRAEPLQLCLDCHAPEPDPTVGVSCVTCHVDDGVVRAVTVSGAAPHPSRVDPTLRSASFCATCHDFNFVAVHPDGGTAWTDEPMQATYREWQAWGGEQTCQGCHMADGHTFPGAHDVAYLARAVSIEATAGPPPRLVLQSRDVGHAMPTGDLFRHMTAQVYIDDQWVIAGWLGRRFAPRFNEALALYERTLVADTRLQPGQPMTITAPASATAWRLMYHYTDSDEHGHILASGTF